MKKYTAKQRSLERVNDPHGHNSVKEYGFKYKPEIWQANTVYEADYNVVRPPVHNGFQYELISNGESGAAEPTWATKEGGIVIDGEVEYKAVRYGTFLRPDELLKAVTGSSWTASDSVPIVSDSYTVEGEVKVEVGPPGSGIKKFTLTNTVEKENGVTISRSYLIEVINR